MRKRIPIEKEKLLFRNSVIPDFTVDHLDRFATLVAKGRFPMKHHEMYITDAKSKGTGLKASVLKTGHWSFKIEYSVKKEPGRRIYVGIGKPPEMTVERAREIANMVSMIKKRPGITAEQVRSIIEKAIENVASNG